MDLLSVRTDLSELLATVDGIAAVADYPPDFVAIVPMAWLGDASGTVVMGDREIWTYEIPLTIAVHRSAEYNAESVAVAGFVENVMQAIRSNYTLDNTTMGLAVTGFREGNVQIGEEKFVGFTLTLKIKETHAQQLS